MEGTSPLLVVRTEAVGAAVAEEEGEEELGVSKSPERALLRSLGSWMSEDLRPLLTL